MVRREHIIRGSFIAAAYYCGACLHEWQIPGPEPPQQLPPRPKPRTHMFGPKRKSAPETSPAMDFRCPVCDARPDGVPYSEATHLDKVLVSVRCVFCDYHWTLERPNSQ